MSIVYAPPPCSIVSMGWASARPFPPPAPKTTPNQAKNNANSGEISANRHAVMRSCAKISANPTQINAVLAALSACGMIIRANRAAISRRPAP